MKISVKTKVLIIKGVIAICCIVLFAAFCIVVQRFALYHAIPYLFAAFYFLCWLVIFNILEINWVKNLFIANRFNDNYYFKACENKFYISNKNVAIIYDSKLNRLYMQNLLNKVQEFCMNNCYFDVNGVGVDIKPFNIFKMAADYFDEKLTYDELISDLKTIGTHIRSRNFLNIQVKKQNVLPKNNIKTLIIDINIDSPMDIAKLPGINIACAKRVVKYRQEQSGFKTKEEFFKVARIKKRYVEVIEKSVVIGKYHMLNEYKIEEIENINQEGRQIDF